MKDINWANILNKFSYKIYFENMEKSEVEKTNFRRGGVKFDPPLVLKGLKVTLLD